MELNYCCIKMTILRVVGPIFSSLPGQTFVDCLSYNVQYVEFWQRYVVWNRLDDKYVNTPNCWKCFIKATENIFLSLYCLI